MPQWVIPRVISAVLLCSIIVAPFIGCGKKVTSSTGESASSSKGKSAGPVEKISPDPMATFPVEKSASTAREPVEAAPPASSAGGATESGAAPPAALSAPFGAAGEALSLGDIFFDFDQYTIRRDAQSILSANAAWFNGRPGKAVVIEGHCDERGTQAYNLVLGEKRARSVKRYLEDLGVPASRLKTTSYGELRPFCKERDESCYQQNRRAHFAVQ
jgi:peptidoglycan-associated lipoprotein